MVFYWVFTERSRGRGGGKRRSRRAIAAGLGVILAACVAEDPCGGRGGSFIELVVIVLVGLRLGSLRSESSERRLLVRRKVGGGAGCGGC